MFNFNFFLFSLKAIFEILGTIALTEDAFTQIKRHLSNLAFLSVGSRVMNNFGKTRSAIQIENFI